MRPEVSEPRYKWGSVKAASVGTVTKLSDRECTVDFPEQSGESHCDEGGTREGVFFVCVGG